LFAVCDSKGTFFLHSGRDGRPGRRSRALALRGGFAYWHIRGSFAKFDLTY
jgi:hypothetical protein